MAVHVYDDPEFFASITSEELLFSRDIAHDAGIDLGAIKLGDGPEAPAAMMLQLPAGYRLERHAHETNRVEVIVRGSVTLPDGRVLRAGDIQVSEPGVNYGPLVAGPNGATTLELFASVTGLAPVPADDDSAEARAFLQDIREKTHRAQARV